MTDLQQRLRLLRQQADQARRLALQIREGQDRDQLLRFTDDIDRQIAELERDVASKDGAGKDGAGKDMSGKDG